jgi:hypothetical protein
MRNPSPTRARTRRSARSWTNRPSRLSKRSTPNSPPASAGVKSARKRTREAVSRQVTRSPGPSVVTNISSAGSPATNVRGTERIDAHHGSSATSIWVESAPVSRKKA